MELRFTTQAERDIGAIVRSSGDRFGQRHARAYADLLGMALRLIADDPSRPASRVLPESGPGVRSLHMSIAARRRAAARHVIYYRIETGAQRIVVLRVLHEAMDPAARVAVALRNDLTRS